jgi:hypothetical protein
MYEKLDQLVKKTFSFPEISIINQPLGEGKLFETTITEEDLKIITKTIQDGYLNVPIHNDRQYLESNDILPGGNKFITNKMTRKPLGIFTVELEGGYLVRNSNDYRYLTKDQMIKNKYFFVYDEKMGSYGQFTEIQEGKNLNKNQKMAQESMNEFNEAYSDLLKINFAARRFLRGFLKNTPVSEFFKPQELARFINDYEQFVEQAKLFLKTHFVFGTISKDEYKKISKKIDEIESKLNAIKHSLDNDETFKRCSNLFDFVLRFLEPRKEFIANELAIIQNLDAGDQSSLEKRAAVNSRLVQMGGYFLDGDHIYPTIFEIERRKNSSVNFDCDSEEAAFIALITKLIQQK